MKNPITTKDLMAINDLTLFEQWSSTKYRHFYDSIKDKDIRKVMKEACLSHQASRDKLISFMEENK